MSLSGSVAVREGGEGGGAQHALWHYLLRLSQQLEVTARPHGAVVMVSTCDPKLTSQRETKRAVTSSKVCSATVRHRPFNSKARPATKAATSSNQM